MGHIELALSKAGLPAEAESVGGRSLPVKRLLAKEKTEGPIPFARSHIADRGPVGTGLTDR